MTPALYEKLYGEAPDFNSVFWCTDESQETAEEIGENLLNQDAVLNITYTASLKDQIDSMLGAMDIVMIVIIVSAGMLAFVVLYNLNNININERRRELATLKVLGFFSTEVAAYVYRENILLTVIGAALGVFLGKFLHMYVITTVEVDACMFGRNINFSSFVYGVLFTFGFSIIVNFAMYFKLKKIDMVESLKSIE
jgi:putative ABC transport system permease protein